MHPFHCAYLNSPTSSAPASFSTEHYTPKENDSSSIVFNDLTLTSSSITNQNHPKQKMEEYYKRGQMKYNKPSQRNEPKMTHHNHRKFRANKTSKKNSTIKEQVQIGLHIRRRTCKKEKNNLKTPQVYVPHTHKKLIDKKRNACSHKSMQNKDCIQNENKTPRPSQIKMKTDWTVPILMDKISIESVTPIHDAEYSVTSKPISQPLHNNESMSRHLLNSFSATTFKGDWCRRARPQHWNVNGEKRKSTTTDMSTLSKTNTTNKKRFSSVNNNIQNKLEYQQGEQFSNNVKEILANRDKELENLRIEHSRLKKMKSTQQCHQNEKNTKMDKRLNILRKEHSRLKKMKYKITEQCHQNEKNTKSIGECHTISTIEIEQTKNIQNLSEKERKKQQKTHSLNMIDEVFQLKQTISKLRKREKMQISNFQAQLETKIIDTKASMVEEIRLLKLDLCKKNTSLDHYKVRCSTQATKLQESQVSRNELEVSLKTANEKIHVLQSKYSSTSLTKPSTQTPQKLPEKSNSTQKKKTSTDKNYVRSTSPSSILNTVIAKAKDATVNALTAQVGELYNKVKVLQSRTAELLDEDDEHSMSLEAVKIRYKRLLNDFEACQAENAILVENAILSEAEAVGQSERIATLEAAHHQVKADLIRYKTSEKALRENNISLEAEIRLASKRLGASEAQEAQIEGMVSRMRDDIQMGKCFGSKLVQIQEELNRCKFRDVAKAAAIVARRRVNSKKSWCRDARLLHICNDDEIISLYDTLQEKNIYIEKLESAVARASETLKKLARHQASFPSRRSNPYLNSYYNRSRSSRSVRMSPRIQSSPKQSCFKYIPFVTAASTSKTTNSYIEKYGIE